MNPYEKGERKLIPAALVYARAEGCVLMVHRNARGGSDVHDGKWNGLGGKFEPGESPLEAAAREFREEAGLELGAAEPLGVLQFPEFRPERGEDWLVYVFTAELAVPARSGLIRPTREGDLHWVKEERLLSLPLWEGDRLFLPYVLERRPFVGTFWYRGGRLERHWVRSLGAPLPDPLP